MSKAHVEFSPEKNAFRVLAMNKRTGSEEVKDTIPLVDAMAPDQALKALAGYTSTVSTLRAASLNLVADILEFGKADMEDYRGATPVDKQPDREMNGTFQTLETRYFERFMAPEHPMHEAFLKMLPKNNDRMERLESNGKLSKQKQFQYFLQTLRSKTPSYAEAKNAALQYWAYIGESLRTSTGHCVPAEVMRMRVAEVRVTIPADTSWETRAIAIMRELVMPDDPNKPLTLNSERLNDVKSWLLRTLDAVNESINVAAVQATKRAADANTAVVETGRQDVAEATRQAMDNARMAEGLPPSGTTAPEGEALAKTAQAE